MTAAAGHYSCVGFREIRRRNWTDGKIWMPFIKERLAQAQLCVLVYDPALRGGFVELGIAFAYAIPIWLVARRGSPLSRSVAGCATRIIIYKDGGDLEAQLMLAYQVWRPEPAV